METDFGRHMKAPRVVNTTPIVAIANEGVEINALPFGHQSLDRASVDRD